MITVYYDGRCGLCSREIAHYQDIAPKGVFVWKDVVDHAEELVPWQVSVEQGLKQIHAIEHPTDKTPIPAGNATSPEATLWVGVDAFILMWRHLGPWHWRLLARFTALPGIHFIARVGYRAFGRWRFKGIDYCPMPTKESAPISSSRDKKQ